MLRYDIEDGLQNHLNKTLDMGVRTVMASKNEENGSITLVIVTKGVYYEYIYFRENVYNKDGEKESKKPYIIQEIINFMKSLKEGN